MSCLKGGNNEKEKALAKLAHRDQENQVINEVVFTREMAKRKVRILNLEKDKLIPPIDVILMPNLAINYFCIKIAEKVVIEE